MQRIGITTTVPAEVLYAGGVVPVDLNNEFMRHPERDLLVAEAEAAGYPRQLCCWVKGIFGYVLREKLPQVVAVIQGDCSNSHGLMETLEYRGVRVIPFAYPFDRDREFLSLQYEKLLARLGTDWDRVKRMDARLHRIREKAWELDRLTWEENRVSGPVNHRYMVSCSDYEGDPDRFEESLDGELESARGRALSEPGVRLGYAGVPPIFDDLHERVEQMGARIVFNEVQRQFTFPFDCGNPIDRYLRYTYPYDIFGRIEDIKTQISARRLQGIVHYIQSFCWRGISDHILRRELNVPVLTLEGDRPGPLDGATLVRLEAFVESLARSGREASYS